ncbi:uncharacterized protein LOC135468734 [Liolophura sinensis]|uniref:uncharacterized protein LOC135468734 n=1 Tax=Liolophura sinensis TaxID=3198878 RepID=UPI0031595E5C
MSHYIRAERKHFAKNVQDCIIKPLLRQRETGELCDVELMLNGLTFTAHKAILSLWSPYFLSMFTCDMREKTTREIDLTESVVLEDDNVFGFILDYMYTGSLVVTADNIEDILRISDFLLLDDVKEYCRQFYRDLGNIDLRNCLRTRFLAENHNLIDVRDCCQKIIESRFHDYLIYNDEILELPASCLLRLLEDPNVVQHTTYIDLKYLVQRWIDSDFEARKCHSNILGTCIKLWGCDDDSNPRTSVVEQEENIGGDLVNKIMQPQLPEQLSNQVPAPNPCLTSIGEGRFASIPSIDESDSEDDPSLYSQGSYVSVSYCPLHDQEQQVLFSVVCNQGLKFLKVLVYDIENQKWFHYPIAGEKVLHNIPSRQTVCNLVTNDHHLYMYLCSSFPYPTDMLKINILVLDLLHAQSSLYSFRTVDYYNPCYRTTLTNIRNVPPAMVFCASSLYVLGNKEGTGHLFMCNLTNHQYTCYQIPGCRFISLARAVVKDNRYIYVWYRHRTGPSEEFCIKKSVGFAMFDTQTKIFNSWQVLPPEISYDDFARAYLMTVRDDTVIIYMPGKPALVLDEVRCKWVTSLRKIPMPPSFSDNGSLADTFQLQTFTENSIFILNNEAPYTTSIAEVMESLPHAVPHTPPPIDHISMVTSGHLPQSVIQTLDKFDLYDDAYAVALHVSMRCSDLEGEDSCTSHSDDQDTDNDYEYDDEIYDYDYDFNFSI